MAFKRSRYNVEVKTDTVIHLANTLSGASFELGKAECKSVNAVLAEAASGSLRPEWSDISSLLLDHGFLVPAEIDEISIALSKYDTGRKDPNSMSLTIVTTIKCNMGCYYCFEDRNSTEALASHDIKEIIRFVSDRLKRDGSLHVRWFGGEPLISKEFVLDASQALMKLAADRGARYSAGMATNGYKLDANTARELRNHNIESVQITLDGTRAVHDTVRRHLDPESRERVGSYTQIIENIQGACEFLEVNIRVNVSKLNAYSIIELIDDLAKSGLNKKISSIYFAPLHSFKVSGDKSKYNPKERVHFSNRDFADVEADLMEHAASLGFQLRDWANPAYSGCIAVSENGFIIDSNGEVKKCDHEIGVRDTAIASLRTPLIRNVESEQKWEKYRPETNTGCAECVLLPVCYSNCPHINMSSESLEIADKCPSHKYNWNRTLPLILSQRGNSA